MALAARRGEPLLEPTTLPAKTAVGVTPPSPRQRQQQQKQGQQRMTAGMGGLPAMATPLASHASGGAGTRGIAPSAGGPRSKSDFAEEPTETIDSDAGGGPGQVRSQIECSLAEAAPPHVLQLPNSDSEPARILPLRVRCALAGAVFPPALVAKARSMGIVAVTSEGGFAVHGLSQALGPTPSQAW